MVMFHSYISLPKGHISFHKRMMEKGCWYLTLFDWRFDTWAAHGLPMAAPRNVTKFADLMSSPASASCAQKSGRSEELSRGACHNVNFGLSRKSVLDGCCMMLACREIHIAMDALLGSALLGSTHETTKKGPKKTALQS